MPTTPHQTLSHLLDRSFALWWRSLRWTAPLALLAALPSLRPMLSLPTLGELQADPEAVSLGVIEPLLQPDTWRYWGLSALLALWLAGAQALLLDRLLRGEPVHLLQSIAAATLRLPRLLLSSLLYALLCAMPLLPLLVFNAWLGLQGLDLLPMMLLSMASSALFALPVAWIAVRLLFMPYAAALDELGPWRGMQHSRAIAGGQWWRLLVFLSVPLTAYAVAGAGAAALPSGLESLIGTTAARSAGQIAALLVAAISGPMVHACLVCAYRELSAAQQQEPLDQA
jgi:hypothetical protein